jgi:hypothetical protein
MKWASFEEPNIYVYERPYLKFESGLWYPVAMGVDISNACEETITQFE